MLRPRNRAFTLIELLVVTAIIAVLIGLVFMLAPGMLERGRATASLNNMRNLAAGFQMYANDNDFFLPSRVEGGSEKKWPRLLHDDYGVNDVKVFADPGDPQNFLRTKRDPLSNGDGQNNTSYVMNGFNDRGTLSDPTVSVKLNSIEKPSDTILLANQSGARNFYVDVDEGDQRGVVRTRVFNGGANYVFVDGSARFLKAEDVDDKLWLCFKTPADR